jgi:hypothetical protein
MSTRRTTGLMAGLLLLAPLASLAADEPKTASEPQAATSATELQSDGELAALKAGKDPKTGALRQPTPAENAELTRQIREFWGQFPRHDVKNDRRAGTTSLVVAPHSISTSIATVGADGQVVWGCVDHEASGASVESLLQKLQAQPASKPVAGDR